MTTGRTLLQVSNATKRFGGLIAVNDMSFDVKEHEVMGIIGPNGSGKTTMMNLISGALKVTSGSISMQGRRLSEMSADKISQAGVSRTFQLVRILPGLSIVENVVAGAAFGHRRRWGNEARYHAEALLDRLGLAQHMHQPVFLPSGRACEERRDIGAGYRRSQAHQLEQRLNKAHPPHSANFGQGGV